MSTPESLDLGKLSTASATDAPLLIVFGGVDVGGKSSGVYMWSYVNSVADKFHIFVARDPSVDGTKAYSNVMDALKAKSVTPSKQILYLFSGGYRPGMSLLSSSGAATFSSILLVDIWMGSTKVADYYKNLSDTSAAKMSYIYTAFGANNEAARDYIAKQVGSRAVLIKGGTMADHMRTNTTAVSKLT